MAKITGKALVLVRKSTFFDPVNPEKTPAHAFVYVSTDNASKDGSHKSNWSVDGCVLAPVRGNRELALPSNLMNVTTERGDIDVNPCKQVKRNQERARTEAPEPEQLRTFIEWLSDRSRVSIHKGLG